MACGKQSSGREDTIVISSDSDVTIDLPTEFPLLFGGSREDSSTDYDFLEDDDSLAPPRIHLKGPDAGGSSPFRPSPLDAEQSPASSTSTSLTSDILTSHQEVVSGGGQK